LRTLKEKKASFIWVLAAIITMAGPVCSILLEKPIDDILLNRLNDYVNDIGDMFSDFEKHKMDDFCSWDFSVKLHKIILRREDDTGCVFSIHTWNGLIAEAYSSYEIDEDILLQIDHQIGFRPHGHIQLEAGCNGDIDHLLLGHIAFCLIENLGGYIDFGGVLLDRKNNPVYEGKLFDIWYENPNGKLYYQIADKLFLENYIKDNNFRLIK
jgi:hypothetical protein